MDRNEALELLKSDDARIRVRAARELRRWNDPEAKRLLVHAIGDPALDVREAAVRSLMEVGDASTVPHLLPLLRNGTPAIRNGARQVLEQLCRIEPGTLRELCSDPDPRMRVFSANIMGGTGDHDFVPSLLGLLSDAETNVVEAALSALGQLGSSEAVESLSRLAVNADPWLRFSAIDALGRIPDLSAARVLLALLPTAGPDFAEPIVEALGRQGCAASVLPLVALVESRPDLRSALLRTLLGPLAPQVASLGRDSRLEPLARAAAEALGKNELPSRIAATTAVLLAGIRSEGGRENA